MHSVITRILSCNVLNFRCFQNILPLIIICGLFLELCGGIWDSLSHITNEPESFWTIQHTVVYIGVCMIFIFSVLGLLFLIKNYIDIIKKGLGIIVIGSTLQIVAGYADSIAHSFFGLDGLISWPHQMLEFGLVVISFGVFLILIKNKNKQYNNIMLHLSVVSMILSTIWIFFNLSLLVAGIILCIPIYKIFLVGCAIL